MDLRLVGNRAFAVFSSLFNPRPVALLPVFSTNKWLEVANDQLRCSNDFSPEEKQDSSLSLNQVCHGKKRISNSAVKRGTTTLRRTRFCCFSRQVEKLLQLTFCSTGSRQAVEERPERDWNIDAESDFLWIHSCLTSWSQEFLLFYIHTDKCGDISSFWIPWRPRWLDESPVLNEQIPLKHNVFKWKREKFLHSASLPVQRRCTFTYQRAQPHVWNFKCVLLWCWRVATLTCEELVCPFDKIDRLPFWVGANPYKDAQQPTL